MSEQQLRPIKRVDYSKSGSQKRTLDSYSRARQPPNDTDDSPSDEAHSSQSESDNLTVVARGGSLKLCLICQWSSAG